MSLPVHPLAGQRVGYARISGASQNLDGQTDTLTGAGCGKIFADTAPGKLAERPELTKVILRIHRGASEFGMKNPAEVVAMAVAKLGQKKEAIEASVGNVELTWRFGPTEIQQSKTYAEHMLELKQIKELPDFATFFDTRFVDEIAKEA